MRGSGARAALPALAVLALAGVVAVAATGTTEGGSAETRRPTDALVDTIFSLSLVAMLAFGAVLVYALAHRSRREYPRSRGGLMSLGLLAALAVLLANLHVRGWLFSQSSEGGKPPVVGATPNASGNGAEHVDRAHFAWLPATIVFALAAIGVAAILLAERRRRARADARKTVGEAIADVLAETLADLLAEADPRRAVIAAYARLVRVLAARGLPRRAPETPGEYLARILGRLDVDTRSVQRLTDLFTRAEFSQHAVDEAMKKEAIGALARVCDELRAAQAGSGQVPTEGLQVSAGSA